MKAGTKGGQGMYKCYCIISISIISIIISIIIIIISFVKTVTGQERAVHAQLWNHPR